LGKCTTIWATSVNEKLAQVSKNPNRRKFAQSGHSGHPFVAILTNQISAEKRL
jgi:hypothetical protein